MSNREDLTENPPVASRYNPCSTRPMEPKKTDQPAPHAGEREEAAGQGMENARPPTPKDADRPASKPQGTLQDQIKTMESEGQAQPQAGDLHPQEHPQGHPQGEKDRLNRDQRKLAEDGTGF